MSKLNFCFFGSSDFSLYVLRTIIKKFKPLIVFTLPAKKQGRGLKIQPNIVYSFCLKKKLPVIEIENFDNFNYSFEFGLLAGFGKIIPSNIIQAFPKGIINIHPSLLPKYRGPNPIREVILNGEQETGVSLFLIDEKIDHGPLIYQEKYELKGKEIYKGLEEKLGVFGGQLFNKIIEKYLKGEIELKAQDDNLATYTRKFSKEDGLLKFNEGYQTWDRKIRALNPWPGTFFFLDNKILKIFSIKKINEKELNEKIRKNIKIGEFFEFKNSLGIRIQDAFLILEELQLEGRKKMSSKEFLNGFRRIIFKKGKI